MYKKKLALFICVAMVGAVTACAGAGAASSTSSSEKLAEENTVSENDAYPKQSINLIIPYSAGGGTDSLLRLVASSMEPELGQSIIVSNVTGGGGQVGITQLFNSKGDGYNIGAVTDTDHYITVLTGENVAYDIDSFKYIGSVNTSCDVIMVNKSTGFENLEQLISYAKDHPGEVTVGVSGQVHVLDLGKLSSVTDTVFTPIMHDGASDSFSACLGGQVDALIIDKKFVAQAEGQDLVVLGSFGAERLEAIKDVPTMKELGYDIESSSCRLIIAPKDTPDEDIAILSDAMKKTTETQEFQDSLVGMSEVYKFTTPEELTKQVHDDYESLKGLLEENPDL